MGSAEHWYTGSDRDEGDPTYLGGTFLQWWTQQHRARVRRKYGLVKGYGLLKTSG